MNVKEKHTGRPSKTNWAKVEAVRDADIDYKNNPPLEDDF